jgi:hypothetical protein
MEEVLSYLPTLFQAGKGIADLIQGNAFSNTPRPQYNIPPEVAQQVALARSGAASPLLPGQGLMEDKIKGNTAAGVNTAIQGGNPNGAIGALVNNENNQFTNLDIAGVTRQDKNRAAYGEALGNEATYEDKAFEWNKAKPYEYAQTASNTFTQGGLGEIFNSIKGGGQTYMLLDMLKKLQGNNYNLSSIPSFDNTNDPRVLPGGVQG